MAEVYVSIGSNIEPQRNICGGLDVLAEQFELAAISPVYQSESVGFAGEDFLNLVLLLHTELTVAQLSARFRAIEHQFGRDRQAPKFSSRTLDIDILTYDQCCGVVDGVRLPREEICKNAFVLRPLADIATAVRHPAKKQSYGELWQAFDQRSQRLWPVPFAWHDRQL